MIENLKVRWGIIFAIIAVTIICTVPNFVSTEKMWWPTKSKMVLGLDIQGGSHLVLRVDVDSAVRQDANRIAEGFKQEMADSSEKVTVDTVKVLDPLRGEITVEGANPAAIQEYINKYYGQTFQITETTGNVVKMQFAELHLRDFKSKLLDQAIATIRNRIDEFGVAEPSITAQGSDRILVQLPGIKDASTAKDLINRTARLDFMIVDTSVAPADLDKMIKEAEEKDGIKLGELKYSKYVDRINEALKGKIPENTVVYFEKPENAVSMEVARIPMLLKMNEMVAGSSLTNAFVTMDQFGAPVVSFTFDNQGTRQFADLTRKHTNQNMAIVLDKVIKSAPNIREPITQGRGQITLGGGRDMQQTLNEAKIISTALRAGALPATLEQLEERTVGPSLGADAIRQGKIGTIVAALAVFVFMIIFYRSFGFIADVALALNVLMTVAILSLLGATLTLPGIAGLALTLGISVDASVIIFERIKEELGKGTTMVNAIREGYDRAFSSILDSNLTSIAVCVVLYYYGTGPVRGFAVTLLTGLVITTFTAVFFTRSVLEQLVVKWKWNLALKW